ncbi:MAG: hypothetical protein ACK4G3_04470, partial [bacterium]
PQKEHRLFLLRVDLPEPVLVSFKTSLQKYYQIEEVQENDTIIWNIKEIEKKEEKKEGSKEEKKGGEEEKKKEVKEE